MDESIRLVGYQNRSEFIRDLIRDHLVKRQWSDNQVVIATLMLIYNHHIHGLTEKLTDVQHHHHQTILATTHVHLSHDLCAEMTLMRGKAADLHKLAGEIQQHKGVLHASLAMSSTGEDLS
jgi:CopG family nickel-responsive transcriptional regulator